MNILVSIVVVIYNSAEFVLDTLESIKNQTYKHLELIVTDDCSSDNTISIVRSWLNKNAERFTFVSLVESEFNTGVSANCNRGLTHVKGMYVKYIAGDDILLSNCIEDNLKFAYQHNIEFLSSRIETFGDQDIPLILIKRYMDTQEEWIHYFSYDAQKQFERLVKTDNFIYGASMFMKVETLRQFNGFDEQISFIEDYPLWIRVTRSSKKINFLDKVTVKYRLHSNSVSALEGFLPDRALNSRFQQNMYKLYRLYRRPYLSGFLRLDWDIHYLIINIAILFGNKKYIFNLLKILKVLSPLFIRTKLKKIIERRSCNNGC